MTTVRIDEKNANADVWFCESKQEYHWCLVWEDGSAYGTHMSSGSSPTRFGARSEIVKHILWAEDMWPRYEYFDGPRSFRPTLSRPLEHS